MKKNMLFIIMAGITFLFTACGKTQDSSNDVTEYVSQQETEQSESSTPQNDEVKTLEPGDYLIRDDENGDSILHIPDENAEPEEEEAIGDVDTPDDSFGRLTLDSMMEYSVGTDGDMVVPASPFDTTIEDVIADLKVVFPMKPYYEGEIENEGDFAQFIASNGDYNYQMAFDTAPTKGIRQTAEDEGGILYEETDNYIIDVQHGNADANKEVRYGGAKIKVHNKTTGVTLEIMLTCGMEEGAADGTGAKFGEFDEWVRANVDLIKSKLQ